MLTLQLLHFFCFARRGRWAVQSGWILHFHLSESQTWTQVGSDRWECPVSIRNTVTIVWHQLRLSESRSYLFISIFEHIVFVLAYIASELARTPAKTVTFSTTPDTEPSTPTRTGHSEFSGLASCLLVLFLTYSWYLDSVSVWLDHRSENKTPQRVSPSGVFFFFFSIFSHKLWSSGISAMMSSQYNLCFLCDRGRRFSLSLQRPTGSGREWQVSLTCYNRNRISYCCSNKWL